MQLAPAIALSLLNVSPSSIPAEAIHCVPQHGIIESAGVDSIEADEIQVIEDDHRWYNQRWNDLLGLDGEWEELVDGERSVLRPLGDGCSIGIRPTWKDEVLYFPVTAKGEVVIERGWIRINQLGQASIAAELAPSADDGSSRALVAAPDDCVNEIDTDAVAEVLLGGTCWEPAPPSGGCVGGMSCSGGDGGGCTLDFVMHSTTRSSTDSYAAECGAGLSYSNCPGSQGKRYYCVREG